MTHAEVLIMLMIGTLITGLVAAGYWYRASKIAVVPSWKTEPGLAEASMAGWLAGSITAFSGSGHLNRVAALWTMATVVLGTASNLYGAYLNLPQ